MVEIPSILIIFFLNPPFGHDYQEHLIDPETRTILELPEQEKYDDTYSAITLEYEIITTFIKIHNISATFERAIGWENLDNSTYQFALGSWWCSEGLAFECCPPM